MNKINKFLLARGKFMPEMQDLLTALADHSLKLNKE